MVRDVTASVKLAADGVTSWAAVATPMTTKANSPPGPSSRPVSIAASRGTRNRRASPKISAALTPIRPITHARSNSGACASSRKSMFMPTVKKNRPSSRPLNGSMVVSIALRNSDSDRSRPATKAPSAIDMPASPAITALATMTNSVAATNSSLVPAAATSRNRGRSSSRPTMTMTPSATAALATASASPVSTEPPAPCWPGWTRTAGSARPPGPAPAGWRSWCGRRSSTGGAGWTAPPARWPSTTGPGTSR